MGRIKFTFMSMDKDNNSYQFQYEAKKQLLYKLYGIFDIEKIEFDGNDFNIEIDFSNNIRNIKWIDMKYPNETIKKQVCEIAYYYKQASELKELLNDILRCKYENKFELEKLGKTAKKRINELEERTCFTKTHFNKQRTINDINHTLNKEVDKLINSTKERDSNRKKEEALNEAKEHLYRDINFFLDEMMLFEFD